MRLILNILWLVFAGVWAAIGWLAAAVIMFITIIGIPFGIAAVRIALFTLWPFGRTTVKRQSAGVPSAIGNVLWVLLCGWWLALIHIVAGVALCITVIGIPFGLANFKLVRVSFLPLGRDIVTVEEAARLGVATEVAV